MKVSICIPEYNAEKYIEKNLNSILAQTYEAIEIILVDDASSDRTKELMEHYAETYPDKIKAYYASENRGIGATKNTALFHASGEYVFFCDCDDLLKPNCIEALVQEAIRSGYPDMVIDGFTRMDSDGNLMYERTYASKEEALQQSVPLFAKLLKRSFLNKNDIISPIGVIIEDVLYQAMTVPNQPTVSFINNCGYIWIKNVTSASHTRLSGFDNKKLEASFEYLHQAELNLQSEEAKQCMYYYVMQFIVWHLLRSGSGVGAKETYVEYKRAETYMNQYFPDYKKLSYVSFRKPVGTRRVVRLAVLGIAILMKLHLAGIFFALYGMFDFSRFWPEL